MQCSVSEGESLAVEAHREGPVPTPSAPWQPGEYIAFAASMANQVAQRLSPHEDLVAGMVLEAYAGGTDKHEEEAAALPGGQPSLPRTSLVLPGDLLETS